MPDFVHQPRTDANHAARHEVSKRSIRGSTGAQSDSGAIGYIDGFDFSRTIPETSSIRSKYEHSSVSLTGTQYSSISGAGRTLRRRRERTMTTLSSSSSFSCTSLGELRLPPWKDLQKSGLEDGRFQSQDFLRTPIQERANALDTPASSEACTQGHSSSVGDYLSVTSLREKSLAKGRLRKYASLDFELDTIVSLSQHSENITAGSGGIHGLGTRYHEDGDEDETEADRRTKSLPLTSLPLWSPLKSFRFPRSQAQVPDLQVTPTSSGITGYSPLSSQMNKLRKKIRTPLTDHLNVAGTGAATIPMNQDPSSAKPQPQPILDLPSGLEQIGHGIGYTFVRSSTSLPPGRNETGLPRKDSVEFTSTPRRRALSLRVFPSGSGSGAPPGKPRIKETDYYPN